MNDSSQAAWRAARGQAISAFVREFVPGDNQDFYEDILLTVTRMAKDGAQRGEVKLIARALAELRYALKMFAPYRQIPKISIFGSSRTPENDPDYVAAADFARLMREDGWMIITGAGDGIMKAGHGGAGRDASFGVAIRLPFEQKTNEIIAEDAKLANFRYFFTRKLMFMKESSAVALFPGGFGTQDEGFEALTLIQTGKAPIVPIVMCERKGGSYWPHWQRYVEEELLAKRMIGSPDMSLIFITDDVKVAAEHVIRFYRVYHSSRYVNDDLIIRLQRPISDAALARLNTEHAGCIASGALERTGAMPEEADDYPDLPRLRLRFDKRSYGLLRRMIDAINESP